MKMRRLISTVLAVLLVAFLLPRPSSAFQSSPKSNTLSTLGKFELARNVKSSGSLSKVALANKSSDGNSISAVKILTHSSQKGASQKSQLNSGTEFAPGKNGTAGKSLDTTHGKSCNARSINPNKNSNGILNGNGEAADCATSPVYNLGDLGPAGGVIFYKNESGFLCGPTNSETCHYLEVAPEGWSGTALDPHFAWSASSFTSLNIATIVDDFGPIPNNSQIGLGYFNSLQIVNQSGTCASISTCTYAAGAARAYSTNVGMQLFSDWFLPNVSELNQLCKYVKGQAWTSDQTACATSAAPTLGIQSTMSYWSSTEGDTEYRAWVQYMGSGSQFGQAYKGESATQWVRPIRSF